jgi:polyhydroxybutyrate depolymerase
MMAYRLGCELPSVFAAVGSVASTMPIYLLPSCNNSAPVPVIVFQGTDDGVIPWTGVQGAYLSAAQTVGFWGNHNACTDELTIEMMPDTVSTPDDFTLVVRQEVIGCAADVVVYGVYFGGHTWPGHPLNAPQLGQTTLDVDATALTWEFFKARVNAYSADEAAE